MTETASSSSSYAHVDPPPAPSSQVLTGLVVGVVIVAALYFGKEVLLPVTVAVLLSFLLSPLVWVLRRIWIPRIVAVVFSVVLTLATIGGVGILVASQLVQVAADLPRYQTTIEDKIDVVRSAAIGRVVELVSRVRGTLGQSGTTSSPAPPSANPAAAPAPVPVEVRQPPPDPLAVAQTILTPVLRPLATAAIIFIVTVFILMQKDDLRDRLIRLFGSQDLHRTTLAIEDAARRLSRYFLVQLGINTAFGVVVGTGLYFIGLPTPLLWGTTAALLRFVPYIGSYLGAGVPILLAAAVNPGWSMAFWVAALFLATEPFLGQVVEPLLYGRSTGLSPISVVISAIFWTWLWGPVGLILSTPMMLCLVVLGQHIKQLEFLNVLFGDRPALTSIENFYQRVLAGDVDEVQEHAEDLLKEISLSSYYDEVALKGLELAAHDAARGVLTHEQMERIKGVVTTLITELSEYDDVDPKPTDGPIGPPDEMNATTEVFEQRAPSVAPSENEVPPGGQDKARVRCIACRSPLDEAIVLMLAQLLNKHGFAADVVTPSTVSRSEIGKFGSEGEMICVCYINASRSTSALRFLLRRLRQRVPNARLLLALWPSDPLAGREARAVDAVETVRSLRAVVNLCSKTIREMREADVPTPDQTVSTLQW